MGGAVRELCLKAGFETFPSKEAVRAGGASGQPLGRWPRARATQRLRARWWEAGGRASPVIQRSRKSGVLGEGFLFLILERERERERERKNEHHMGQIEQVPTWVQGPSLLGSKPLVSQVRTLRPGEKKGLLLKVRLEPPGQADKRGSRSPRGAQGCG